jgi:hypothetical protein
MNKTITNHSKRMRQQYENAVLGNQLQRNTVKAIDSDRIEL